MIVNTDDNVTDGIICIYIKSDSIKSELGVVLSLQGNTFPGETSDSK